MSDSEDPTPRRPRPPHDSNLAQLIRRFNDSFMVSEGPLRRDESIRVPSLEHVILPPAEHMKLMCTCKIPAFAVQVDPNTGCQTVTFEDVPDQVMSAFSGTLTTYRVNADSHRFIHDFTFAHIAVDMDVRISQMLGRTGDDTDDLTPDILDVDPEGNVTLIEFTTTRSTTISSLREAFKEKAAKYQTALSLRGRLFNRILYGVIVVSPNRVLTNLPITQDEANVLCLRMNTAMEISGSLIHYMTEPDITDRKQRDRMRVKEELNKMEVNWSLTESAFPHYTREVYMGGILPACISNVADRITEAEELTSAEIKKKVLHERGHIPDDEALEINFKRQEAKINEYLAERRKAEAQEAHDAALGLHGAKAPVSTSGKAIVGFPFWVLENGTGSTSVKITKKKNDFHLPPTGEPCDDVCFKLLDRAVRLANSTPTGQFEESVEEQLRQALSNMPEGDDSDIKKQRREYRRVSICTTEEERVELAKCGVNGKVFRDHSDVRMHRKEKQRPFSIDMEVEEITTFLRTCQWPFYIDSTRRDNSYDFCEEMKCLAEKAYRVHGKTVGKEWLDFLSDWMESNIGRWCNMVSAIGSELAASMKQHCRKDEFVFKKLKDWDVFLLIKPTQTSKHTFFSLMCYNDSFVDDAPDIRGEIFKKTKTNGTITWTDFHSVNNHKLTNWVKCEANMISLIAYWINFFGENIVEVELSDEENTNVKQIWEMFGLTLLISLEDKAVSEQIITMSRYVMMEGFVSFPMLPNPTKMLPKVPPVFRSRLQVWLHNRLLFCMRRVSREPFFLMREDGHVVWSGLFNMFNGESLKEPMQLISLFYIGYLKNKDESAQGNAGGAMAEKIINPELKLPQNPFNLGIGDPTLKDVKFLEYNRSVCMLVIDCGLELLRKMYGSGYKERIEEAILDGLSELNLENLATLKASSTFCPSLEKDNPKVRYKRRKAVEAVRPYVDDGTHVFEVLEKCLKVIEGKRAMHIDLFKKAQHSSIREIYVLAFEERIVQSALECIARAICSLFPSETLTHPRQKAEIPSQHFREALKACGKDHLTVGTSDDAAQWNQGHMVTKFMQMMVRLTPKYMHAFIVRGMSMFDCKKMRMDEATLNALRNARVEGFRAPIMEKMRQRYYDMAGSEDFRVTRPYSTYIQTSSGMMQGILHYTSSLWHTMLQEFLRGYFQQKMSNLDLANLRPHVSVMQSSDDSAVLISFPKMSCPDDTRAMYLTSWLFEFKKHFGKLMGIYPSEKCTSNTLSIVEFNSEFYFHSDIVRPLFRWISAVNTMSEADSLAARQEEMSNNLTAIVSGGGGFSLTAVCQLGQMLLHYRTLGSGSTRVFPLFSEELMKMPDPSLGFFLLDHPFMAGIMGFKYNLYLTVKKTPVGKKYGAILDSIEKCNPLRKAAKKSERTLQITTSGSLVQSTCVHFGKKDKWIKLIESLKLPKDWKETLDSYPEALYTTPRTKEDLILRIAVKMHSPGVIASLSMNDATVRIMAGSVYILIRHILTDLLSWYNSYSLLPERTSLFKKVSEQEKLFGSHCPATQEQIKVLFPNCGDYEYAEEVGNRFQEVTFIPATRTSRVCSTINLTDTEEVYTINPTVLVAYKWFNQRPRANIGDDLLDAGWRVLKSNIHWIKDTHEETLDASPFAHQVEIRTFLMNLTLRQRSVVISGAPVKKTGGLSNLVTVMCENHAPGKKIPNQYDVERAQMSSEVRLVMHTLYYVLNGPFTSEAKVESIKKVLRECQDITTIKTTRVSRRNILHAMQGMIRGEDLEATVQKITFARLGLIGGFSVRQRMVVGEDDRVHYLGLGVWEGMFQGTSFKMFLWGESTTQPNVLLKVVMSEVRQKPAILSCCAEICRTAGVTNPAVYSLPRRMPAESPTEISMFRLVDFKEQSLRLRAGALCTLDTNLEWRITSGHIQDLRLDVRGRTLSIKASMKHGQGGQRGDITLVSYVANKNDILTNTSLAAELRQIETFSKEPTQSWVRAGSLSLATVKTLVKAITLKKTLPGYNNEEYRRMLTHCLNSSLSRQGIYITQAGTPMPADQPEWAPAGDQAENIVFEDLLNDPETTPGFFSKERFKVDQGEVSAAIKDLREIGEKLPDFLSDEEILRKFPVHYLAEESSFGARVDIDGSPVESRDHPWLDAFVSIVLSVMGRNDLLKLIHERKYHSEHEDLAMLIKVLRQEENVPYRQISREIPVLPTGQDVEDVDSLG
uniref:RNA-dependent RNA polymerase n=1 Tax=Ronne virus TaxID=2707257 RepID=A0A859D1S9_9VIRU|nr:RNA-dependent RNA polymerase [Ronne virus]